MQSAQLDDGGKWHVVPLSNPVMILLRLRGNIITLLLLLLLLLLPTIPPEYFPWLNLCCKKENELLTVVTAYCRLQLTLLLKVAHRIR